MQLSIDAVTRLAQEGYSRRWVASLLGVSENDMRDFVRDHCLQRHFKPRRFQRRECKGGRPKGKNLYPDEELFVMILQVESQYQLYRDFGVGGTLVVARWGSWQAGVEKAQQWREASNQ